MLPFSKCTRNFLRTTQSLLLLKYNYNPSDLLGRGRLQTKIKLYLPAFHLYLDKIVKSTVFREHELVVLVMELQKMSASKQQIEKLSNYIETHVDEFESIESLANLLSIFHRTGIKNEGLIKKMGDKSFQLANKQKQQGIKQNYSIHITKVYIALHKTIGLKKFTSQQLYSCDLNQFKPLFLGFTLQCLWKQGLQNYQVSNDILDFMFQHKENIPFADIHHLRFLWKIVKDERYEKILQYLDNELRGNVSRFEFNEKNESENQLDMEMLGEQKREMKNADNMMNMKEQEGDSFDQEGSDGQEQKISGTKKEELNINVSIAQAMYDSYLNDLYTKYY